MESHREIVLTDRADLLGLVRHVRVSLAARTHVVPREQVRAYARDRLRQKEEEWERACAQDSAKKWLKKIAV
jgi:hypothetical protein